MIDTLSLFSLIFVVFRFSFRRHIDAAADIIFAIFVSDACHHYLPYIARAGCASVAQKGAKTNA
jgi:hypothetical protein